MRCFLVVAHKTVIDDHLIAMVEEVMREEQVRFHLIVPVQHPHDHTWSEGEIEAAAAARLGEAIERFRSIGAIVTGEVGDANPVEAVEHYLRRGEKADEIIVSTLPRGRSTWLKLDVPSRMKRAVTVPVRHLVAERAPAP